MKFSIQEEDGDKQIFFTFKEASEKTGLPSKTIFRVLKSGNVKYFRRSDQKTFYIQGEESESFIQIDGEDFFSAEEIQERFGISRTVFLNQLCKKKTHFLDSGEKSHEVTWISPRFQRLLQALNEKAADEKCMRSRAKKGLSKISSEILGEMSDCIKNYSQSI